eukprot:s7716_g2.t1
MWCKCCEPEPQENLVDVQPREILQTPTPQKKDEQDALAAVIQESAAPTVEVKEAAAASTVAAASTEKEDFPTNLFTVTLDCQGDLGIVLDDLGSRGLVIAAMSAGSARDDGKLQQYDCIVSVNGVNGDVNRMWDILESPGKCTLTASRALPGDRFVAINGTHLKGADLVEAVKKEANLEISALRY